MGLRGEGGDGEEEKIVAKLEISGMDVDDFVDKEFLSYDEELEDEASVVDEEGNVEGLLDLTDVDAALDEEFLGEPRVRSGDDTGDWLVYTWDGDLIMAGAFYDGNELSDYLGDGEYTVYTEDGDEQLIQMSWDVFDRWDTYDSTLVDPQSAEFAELVNFKVPARFDWNATTSDNYRARPEEAGRFFGEFRKTRAALDYSYHVHYQRNRQQLQDEIVKFWVSHGIQAKRPWIVFTAGAMGAGKSHSIKRLQARGLHALDDMVKVDPDTVKYQLPEMQEYISRNPGPNPSAELILAGLATHNESAFLQEMIVSELLERSKHLIVDGSLSNADWFANYFAYIRRRYPHYRIGIVHVVCDPEVIWDRVVDRCRRTGRCISRPVVDLSVKMTPLAVDRLTPLSDFTMVVDSGKGDEDDEKVHITHLSDEMAEVAARTWMDESPEAEGYSSDEVSAVSGSESAGEVLELLDLLKGQRAVELLEIALRHEP